MCGIIGVVGRDSCVNILIDGLRILENRGYDSAGVATVGQNGLTISKHASTGNKDALTALAAEAAPHVADRTGIGHTRWATHGAKTDGNAHPHRDASGRIAVVHNGVIENYNSLKKSLQEQGVIFASETDTEVIAQLVGQAYNKGLPLVDAVKDAIGKLEGTWGLAVIANDQPDSIVVAKNGSPIVIGLSEGASYIASEPAAFSFATRDYVALENGEIAIVRADGSGIDRTRVEKAPDDVIALSPAPFPHWTIKEITEQPDALRRTLNHGARLPTETTVKLGGLESRKDELLRIDHLVIAACGTSFHAALYGAMAMRAMQSFVTVQVVDASELTPHHFPKERSGLLVISQSGETKDVHRAVCMAKDLGLPVFSVVNAVGSLIARDTGCGVYLNAGREHAVASTKAFTTQVTALEMIAVWFAAARDKETGRRRDVVAALHNVPHAIEATLQTRSSCTPVVDALKNKEHLFVLGKGPAEAIAKEGALKIKEITYIHAEGYAGGALKHGPFALISEGTPVILIILNDKHAHLMRTAAEEVRARGAVTVVITDDAKLADGVAHHTIVIPSAGPLTSLLATIPLQLIAYDLAVARGINPDKPRNLAKAVTVD